jgi:uncharacterized phiE125 gp8 family phage protein
VPIKLITAPIAEPVTLPEAKLHLRVDTTDDDTLITTLITAAREMAETITRRALVSQQWKIVADRFPSPMAGRLTEYWLGQQWGLAGMGGVSNFLPTGKTGYEVLLPFAPLISVDSIKYIDPAGVQQTMASSGYKVDDVSEPARIIPAFGQAWPTTRQEANAVEITFTCGYANAAAVPAGIKSWMLIRINTLYENREEVAILSKGKLEPLPYVDRLLDPYRVVSF